MVEVSIVVGLVQPVNQHARPAGVHGLSGRSRWLGDPRDQQQARDTTGWSSPGQWVHVCVFALAFRVSNRKRFGLLA